MKKKYTHHTFRFLFLILISNCTFSNPIFGQQIEWVYEVEDQVNTISNLLWVDKEGNSLYSIIRINPKSPGTIGYGYYLLMLDKNGNYKRTTYVKGCKRSRRILPFGKDKFLSVGKGCGDRSNNIRLYDYEGNTSKIGEAFPGNCFASAWYDDKFTFFTKPGDRWGYSFMAIGGIDKNLNTTYDSIDLSELKREDMGIMFGRESPVRTENGVWVIPTIYGEVKGQSFDPKSGFVIGVKESKIVWRYPKVDNHYKIHSVCEFENKIGAYFKNFDHPGPDVFVFLNKNGEELKSLNISQRYESVRGLAMTKDRIVILDQRFISWYDHDGDLKGQLDIAGLGFIHIGLMKLQRNGDVILTAIKNGNGVMIKITTNEKGKEQSTIEEEKGEVVEAEENDLSESESQVSYVSYGSVDEVLEENIVSATVYPNPTSSYIHFKIDSKVNKEEAFTVQIFDSSGRLVMSEITHRNNAPLNVQNLPSGVYIYRLKSRGSEMINGQFIKANR